jgi:hypothetical protein
VCAFISPSNHKRTTATYTTTTTATYATPKYGPSKPGKNFGDDGQSRDEIIDITTTTPSSSLDERSDDDIFSQAKLEKSQTSSSNSSITHQTKIFTSLMSDLRSICINGSDDDGNIDMSGEVGVLVNAAISKDLTTLINMRGVDGAGIIKTYLEDNEDENTLNEMLVSYVIDILETFVEEAADREDFNKGLMKEIFELVKGRGEEGKIPNEDMVDLWMERNVGR